MESLTRHLPLLAAVALVVAGVALDRWLGTNAAAPTGSPAATFVADGRPTLVEIGMDSCASCRAMHKVLDELRLAHGEQLQVVSINIAQQPERVADWKILAIPTQVLLDSEGPEFYRHVGFLPARTIRQRFAARELPLTPVSASP